MLIKLLRTWSERWRYFIAVCVCCFRPLWTLFCCNVSGSFKSKMLLSRLRSSLHVFSLLYHWGSQVPAIISHLLRKLRSCFFMNEICVSLKQGHFATSLMKDERGKGGDIDREWGCGNSKEAELGVTGQEDGSPLREAVTFLLVTGVGIRGW